MLIVMKFGGTSVGNAERIAQAARLAQASAQEGHQVIVVTSAMSGITNQLIAVAQAAVSGNWQPAVRDNFYERHKAVADQLLTDDPARRKAALAVVAQRLDQFEKLCFGLSMVHELTPRLLDVISGTGERLCAPLLAGAIAALGLESEAIEATELIMTNDQFGAAEPLMDRTREKTRARLQPLLDRGVIPVVTGFIGATEDGVLTTLGRGGSDYSASIIGAAIEAQEIWIWTDVDGVMTANPSEVPEARTMREISYSEASELAYFGAKVLHHKTILPAYKQQIPVRILNSFNPQDPGTRVTVKGHPSARGVKAATSIRNVSLVAISGKGMQGIPGIAAKAFAAVAAERANILMISQASSENNLCFVVNSSEAKGVVKALRAALELDLLQGHIEDISADETVAVVAAVGDKMQGTPGIAGKVFAALGAAAVNVIAISQGSSERNISFIVAAEDAAEAVRAIHRAFELHQPSLEAST
ncbi:MAG TPA: aspartate kinase [Blastocatellia bacterium]|nr:aspartate kinase [Blastocatellia bacterium]